MKRTLEIEESQAKILYKNASREFKQILEDTFGKEFFSVKITARIKTYEDACAELGIAPIDMNNARAHLSSDEINYIKLKTVIEALNEGWVPDWNNTNQKKWIPWFELSSGGFVFYGTYFYYSYANAGYGSRLCLKSGELATYAGKQFIEIFKGFMF